LNTIWYQCVQITDFPLYLQTVKSVEQHTQKYRNRQSKEERALKKYVETGRRRTTRHQGINAHWFLEKEAIFRTGVPIDRLQLHST